jgi:hypothetical protein
LEIAPHTLAGLKISAMTVQYDQAIFWAISVRNQTKKVGNLNRHRIEPFDVGFFIFGLGVENFD